MSEHYKTSPANNQTDNRASLIVVAAESRLNHAPDFSDTDLRGPAPVGRTFILGLPDRSGRFQVYLNGAHWRINAGSYSAGDRVRVMAIRDDHLLVQITSLA
jgi:membrane protein implicated in regulation of membrane protease activity